MAAKTTALKEAMSKTQLITELADSAGVGKKEVKTILEDLSGVIERHVRKRGVGSFTLPGLLKIKTVKVPARKAQKNVPNPFRPGETMDVAARAASVKVRVTPLKKLKDMATS